MKTKLVALTLSAAMIAAAGISAGTLFVSAQDTTPLIYEATGKLEDNETLTYTLPQEQAVTGDALSLKVFMKKTYHYGLPVVISVTSDGQTYTWSETSGTAQGYAYVSADAQQATVDTQIQWNSDGKLEIPYLFYGEIVLPFSELGDSVQITSVSAISIEITAAVKSNFASGDTWRADGSCLYLFGASCVTAGDTGVTHTEELVDFTSLQPEDIDVTVPSGSEVVGELRTASQEDYDVFAAYVESYNDDCETKGDMKIIESFSFDDAFADISSERTAAELLDKFYCSGQISDYSIITGGVEGTALSYNLDSSDYESGANSYAGLHYNFARRAAQDWSGANGITVYVENTASHIASFALEIFQYNLETGKLEQYNLNDAANLYKTLYAYNVETGEEFSYHTQTFMRVPANFKGWIRIPFSQYAAPQWSTAPAYGNTGILDFDKNPVVKISITRLFTANADVELVLDDIALYYGDFSIGSLFDTSKQSIRECIENGSVPA